MAENLIESLLGPHDVEFTHGYCVQIDVEAVVQDMHGHILAIKDTEGRFWNYSNVVFTKKVN